MKWKCVRKHFNMRIVTHNWYVTKPFLKRFFKTAGFCKVAINNFSWFLRSCCFCNCNNCHHSQISLESHFWNLKGIKSIKSEKYCAITVKDMFKDQMCKQLYDQDSRSIMDWLYLLSPEAKKIVLNPDLP